MAPNKTNHQTSSEHLLNSIIENAFFGIMAFESVRNAKNEIIDFKWIFANKVAAKMVDYPVGHLMGSNLLDLLPGNLETGLFDQYVQVVESSESMSTEQHYKADNIDTWFQISASKLEDGFTVTFQDISDFKQAQVELETKGRKYRKLFEESMDPIYLLNSEFKFLTVNSSFLQLFGYSREMLIGESISRLFLSTKDFTALERTLKSNQKIDELEVFLQTLQKNKRFCMINSVSLFDEEKQEQNYLGVIRDMTKRQQAEKDIMEAEKLSMTGKLTRTIGHEIRNPLTNVSLALEQLKDELPENASDAELFINIIERNANRIGKLISDLLNSSKPKELQLVHQPIKDLIKDTLLLIQDRLNLQNMVLKEAYPQEEVALPLDGDQFKIALLNLFINAIEAMESNKGILSILLKIEKGKIILVIEDNGKGISIEHLKHLFEPFFTGKNEGTGLGLTTVQNIIHSHKGKIEVESELGVGTTFTIIFERDAVEKNPQKTTEILQ